MNSQSHGYRAWVFYYSLTTVLCTLVLLAVGALVVGTGSSLSVPDWPLSFGQFFPEMIGGVLYEHGHRMIAGVVGILTLGLCLILLFTEKRLWVKLLGIAALLAVILQAVLGGITVLYRLPPIVSISHACLAQIFFCMMVVLTLVSSRWWHSLSRRPGSAELEPTKMLMVVTTTVFFVQLVFGATMRHLGAGLAIPDFPLSFGQIVPPLVDPAVVIHYCHRVGAGIVAICTIVVATHIYRNHFERLSLVGFVGLLVSLVSVQIVLGALTIWLGRPVWVTTVHLAVGATCLATSVLLTVISFRLGRQEQTENSVSWKSVPVTA